MEDEEAAAVLRAVGRQIKAWREAAGMRQAELGAAIGYGEEMVSSVERARRIPKPDFLDKADEVLGAGGKLSVMKEDVEKARYPKNVRDLTNLEDEAVELGAYTALHVHGLLQTPEYAEALYAMRRPAYTEEEIDRLVAARMARKAVFERVPRTLLTFVQEEATLRRPVGGRMVLRQQLEHILECGGLRHVEIQVMPTDREDHASVSGSFRVLKLRDGKTLAYSAAEMHSRVISDPREVQILEMRYGMIRAQALSPRESLAFIEKMLGEKT
ncbi:helix-turn-helix domain-containing protein [Streptomyces chromofuscus]|uniref:Helix-turn-helix transcriptional regulator n=1 Tax=Streptomyces chromofuscus TaxID=42881 RepID=A0A7M2TH62_STRCW|nr:helix-turn-helix transcriptional regulator [Streptomyces chromofuscus]QOV47235.1 helix-turn-helix transcriptional regulator [Streptomyces chromofuscus]GGT24376.1 transcriptional regulator [Streptomyces chromofuscus]